MRIHPIEGKTFFDEKLILGIMIEDDFGQQAINSHNGDLTGNLDAVIDNLDVLPGLELGRIHLKASLRVLEVIVETFLRIVRRRSIDLAVGIDSPETLGDFLWISLFQQQAIEANARVALRILFDKIGDVFGELDLTEAVGFVEGSDFRKLHYAFL